MDSRLRGNDGVLVGHGLAFELLKVNLNLILNLTESLSELVSHESGSTGIEFGTVIGLSHRP